MQGRKSRYRSADDVEHLVRLNWAQGIRKFFITDDNFARNKEWESIFDRLIELREKDGIPLGLMAMSFDVFAVRRFWLADHRYRWACTAVYVVVLGFLMFLLVNDVGALLG